MSENNLKLPQLTPEEQTALDKIATMKKRAIQYIQEGKTKEEAELAGGVAHHIIDVAYSTVRPWGLPYQNHLYESSNPPGIPSLTERQQRIWDMAMDGMTQNEIAKEMKCSQSTVAFTLKQVRKIKDAAKDVTSRGIHVKYQTRIHLFVHGMELWGKVKGLCLGDDFARDIDEAISLGASEVISTHLDYSPHQLDKLVMDIVLATGGRCVVMADCFATNAIADVHAIYYIRDCIHTKDFPEESKEAGRGIPVNCSICYLDDWIRYLGVTLSQNDAEK